MSSKTYKAIKFYFMFLAFLNIKNTNCFKNEVIKIGKNFPDLS